MTDRFQHSAISAQTANTRGQIVRTYCVHAGADAKEKETAIDFMGHRLKVKLWLNTDAHG